MTFRDVVRRGVNRLISPVDPHEHDGSDLSGDVVFGRMRASQLLAGSIKADEGIDVTGQLFIRNVLQQLNLQDTDNPDLYFIISLNSDITRLMHADISGGSPVFTANMDLLPSGQISIITGPIIFAPAAEGQASLPAIRRDGEATGIWFDDGVVGVSIAGAEVARVTAEGLARANEPAYLLKETVYFTSSGTFAKADYPGLRAIKVKCQGGGGAGGGASTTGANEYAAGNGGNGGHYAESWVLAADLDTSEAVTVGAGGAPGTAGNVAGGAGGASIFDTISGQVRADGGAGGSGSPANSGWLVSTNPATPGAGSSVGDLVLLGGVGDRGAMRHTNSNNGTGGNGGASFLGSERPGAQNGNGAAGLGFGGGGAGGANDGSNGTARSGGAGAPGIVIVEVYV